MDNPDETLARLADDVAAFATELRATQAVLRAVLPLIAAPREDVRAVIAAETHQVLDQLQALGCDEDLQQDFQRCIEALTEGIAPPDQGPAAG